MVKAPIPTGSKNKKLKVITENKLSQESTPKIYRIRKANNNGRPITNKYRLKNIEVDF